MNELFLFWGCGGRRSVVSFVLLCVLSVLIMLSWVLRLYLCASSIHVLQFGCKATCEIFLFSFVLGHIRIPRAKTMKALLKLTPVRNCVNKLSSVTTSVAVPWATYGHQRVQMVHLSQKHQGPRHGIWKSLQRQTWWWVCAYSHRLSAVSLRGWSCWEARYKSLDQFSSPKFLVNCQTASPAFWA